MAINVAMVKELRERTGAGMMDCKKALKQTDGDMEAAIELMRKSGAAKADKKSGRTAAEGRVSMALSDDGKSAALVEVNSETDFASKDEGFAGFVDAVASCILVNKPADVATLSGLALTKDGDTVEAARTALIAKIGENIQVRRFENLSIDDGIIAYYQHGLRIGVAVLLKGGSAELGKDIAMHIAASRPVCVSEADVPAEIVAKERGIQLEIAMNSGKPENIAEKMVIGRMRKYLAEITLVGQPFVKDTEQTVGQLLKAAGAEVLGFTRIEVGEGIEKKQEDFAAEVMSQVKGSS